MGVVSSSSEHVPPGGPPEAPGTAPELPPGLDLLWGRRDRGKRGPRPGLTSDAIVDAAVRVADAEGLEAVSMARVAKELGFTTMSLYRHVTSKDELLQLMYNASAVGAERVPIEGDDWRERLRSWGIIQREVLDRHPWITQMPMGSPPVAPNSMLFVERGLATMDDTTLDDNDKLRILGLIASYTLSDARMANDAVRAAAAAAAAGVETPWTFEGLLRELVDEATYPRMHRLAWAGDGTTQPDEHAEFVFGLERILDGVEAYMDKA